MKLKKPISLMLSFALLCTLCVPSAMAIGPETTTGAAASAMPGGPSSSTTTTPKAVSVTTDFTDSASITHTDAVNILISLGLVKGTLVNNTAYAFQPTRSITRAEIAKIIAIALASGKTLSGTSDYKDVSGHWAEVYISYCTQNGAVSGYENGTFKPDVAVTGYEAAKMLLGTLGVSGLTGDSWKTATKTAGEKIKLFDGITADLNIAITRDDAAQLISNALQASDGTKLPKVLFLTKTATYDSLTLSENTTCCVPAGKYLTLVADGAELPIKAGTYKNASLVVTDAIHATDGLFNGGMTDGKNQPYRCAIMVDQNSVVGAQSVTQAVASGKYDGSTASSIVVNSDNKYFDGIIINDSKYTVNSMLMTADGSGGSDFMGLGAGIVCTGSTNATINDFVFVGNGVLRHGIYAGGEKKDDALTVSVNNSYVRANGSKYDSAATGMSACPWMLGISAKGHARATMTDGYSNVSYNNCILLSDGWGILSTDDVSKPSKWGDTSISLKVKDTVVDVTTDSTEAPSAYGTYAIGACFNQFYGCAIGNASTSDLFTKNKALLPTANGVDYSYNTAKYGLTYAAVVANETAGVGYYDGTQITTKYGVMYHKTNNVRYVAGSTQDTSGTFAEAGKTVVEKSTMNTYGAAFLIKACTPDIEVTNSSIHSDKGVIVQLMTCDDPGMGNDMFKETLFSNADNFAASLEKDTSYEPYTYNLVNRSLFGNDIKNMIEDPQISFTDCNTKNNTAINGDFYNAISVQTNGEGMIWYGQNLILSFNNCTINGNCSSTSALHDQYAYYTDKDGKKITAANTADAIAAGATTGIIDSDNSTLLGNLSNTPTATVNNGVWVTLTNSSVWTPSKVCYLTRLTMDSTSSIQGTVVVNGQTVTPKAGEVYTGAVVVVPQGKTAPQNVKAPAAATAAKVSSASSGM
jgi:hypothetical protein